ncbi:MAG: nucleoside hydrolase-like domain-containing protein [Sphingobium sp.]
MTNKPRVFISTDIGGGDHDDDQSLVHALLYADAINIVGLSQTVAEATPGGRKSDILQVIDAYSKDYSTLKTHGDYPTADYLRSITHQGATVAAPSNGFSKATAGSDAIIKAARDASPGDPLYVLTWGGETDIAQALHDAPDIADSIRLLTVGKQDSDATRYLEKNWKSDIWWVQDLETFRGMYTDDGKNRPFDGSGDWIAKNAKGHGALGDYFDKMSHGIYQQGISPEWEGYGIKMGDTPTLLYVLDTLSGRTSPTQEGWGGEFVKKADNYWTDNSNSALRMGSWDGAKTVSEDRAAYMKDFASRLDRADKAAGQEDAQTAAPPSSPAKPSSGFAGTSGNDTLTGTTKADTIDGGTGNDKIAGMKGADTLTGGSGNDWFIFTSVEDSMPGTPDHITDFIRNRDKIDLSAIDARENSGGNDGFRFIGTKAFSDTSGELRYQKHGDGVLVQADTDGDGRSDLSIILDDRGALLNSADFIL